MDLSTIVTVSSSSLEARSGYALAVGTTIVAPQVAVETPHGDVDAHGVEPPLALYSPGIPLQNKAVATLATKTIKQYCAHLAALGRESSGAERPVGKIADIYAAEPELPRSRSCCIAGAAATLAEGARDTRQGSH